MNEPEVKIEFSNYGTRSGVVDEMKKADAFLKSSKGMYCAFCAKKGKKIFSRYAIRTGSSMTALCETCNKRRNLLRKLSR